MSSTIYVLLYYKFVDINNPKFETMQHKLVCAGIGLKGRIIIAGEGINGTVAGTTAQLRQYKEYMNVHPLFNDIVFKRTPAGKVPFGKLIVKCRDEIVTLGKKVDVNKNGKYLKPEEFHELFRLRTVKGVTSLKRERRMDPAIAESSPSLALQACGFIHPSEGDFIF